MTSLDRALWELHQFLTVPVEKGGSPYAYRFYSPEQFEEDGRLLPFANAPLIEVRVFQSGDYTLTPCDLATRPLGEAVAPERFDASPMVVGRGGLIQPGSLRQPIPDREPPAPVEPAPEVLELAEKQDIAPPSEPPADPAKRSAWRKFWGID